MTPSEKLKRMKEELTKKLANSEFSDLFEDLPEMIVERTRSGFGITKDGGSKKTLKKLAKSTIIGREYKDRLGILSSKTAPPISHLTETGQMLDSVKLKKLSKTRFEIYLEDDRDDGKTNNEVRKYNEEKGRTFLGLTKPESRTLSRNIKKRIDSIIKNIFKKK